MALPLPETRHHPLPETIDDVEHYEEFCKRMAQHEAAKEEERRECELKLIKDGGVAAENVEPVAV